MKPASILCEVNARVLLLAAGVALVLLTSGFVNELLGPSLSFLGPDSSLFEVARWSGRILTMVGLVLVVTAPLLPEMFKATCSAPAALRLADPQLDETPVGKPAIWKLVGVALTGRSAPPVGVAVTITCWLAVDFMLIAFGDSDKVMEGAAVTCTVDVA